MESSLFPPAVDSDERGNTIDAYLQAETTTAQLTAKGAEKEKPAMEIWMKRTRTFVIPDSTVWTMKTRACKAIVGLKGEEEEERKNEREEKKQERLRYTQPHNHTHNIHIHTPSKDQRNLPEVM